MIMHTPNIVRMRNMNGGQRNNRVPINVSGHKSIGDDIGDTVWLHFDLGLVQGGFHTDIASAIALRSQLDYAIKTAKGENLAISSLS